LEELNPETKNRVEERSKYFQFNANRFDNNPQKLLEVSLEIEKRMIIPVSDQKLINEERNIREKSPSTLYLKDKTTEETKADDEIKELEKKRTRDFIKSNPDMFYGVPNEIINSIIESEYFSFRDLGYLLSLPYHLKKIRDDRVTHIVASATSSIPYCNLLKKLDELLYPDKEKIKFLICSVKVSGKGKEEQDNKFIEYFSNQKDVRVGAFDECASSDIHAKHNKRHTVTAVKNYLEKLLSIKVTGRYGVDTVFPSAGPGHQFTAGTSSYGDEGSGNCLTFMSDLIENDKTTEKGKPLNIFGTVYDNKWNIIDPAGYRRKAKGKEGLRRIEKLERLAGIAYENFSHNPDSIWNPFNFKIRLAISDDYSPIENDFEEW
jgi:hypothetical protein